MKRRVVGMLAAAAVVAAAAAPEPLALGIADGKAPAWRGISSDEAAGAQGLNMLYPAPNAGGLLAAILAHALVVQGGRAAERSARQAEADRVLEPHADTLGTLTAERMLADARERLPPSLLERSRGLVIRMEPQFALAPDQRTLVLDNTLRVHATDTPAVARFENTVRVVSVPREEADPAAYWAAEGGSALRRESAALLAHSLEVALTPLGEPDPQAYRTQRYRFGSAQKMERGQPLAQGCARVVLRTLRDWLMSVPVAPAAEAPPCLDPYALSPG